MNIIVGGIAVIVILAALVAWVVIPEWRDQRKTGRHHAGQVRRHDPFADLAECEDPDWAEAVAAGIEADHKAATIGAVFGGSHSGDWVARMTGRPNCLPGCDRLDAHDGDQLGACMHGGRAMTATLAAGTGMFEALPDDPPADITGTQPADVRYLGKTFEAHWDELVAKHAGGES